MIARHAPPAPSSTDDASQDTILAVALPRAAPLDRDLLTSVAGASQRARDAPAQRDDYGSHGIAGNRRPRRSLEAMADSD